MSIIRLLLSHGSAMRSWPLAARQWRGGEAQSAPAVAASNGWRLL